MSFLEKIGFLGEGKSKDREVANQQTGRAFSLVPKISLQKRAHEAQGESRAAKGALARRVSEKLGGRRGDAPFGKNFREQRFPELKRGGVLKFFTRTLSSGLNKSRGS